MDQPSSARGLPAGCVLRACRVWSVTREYLDDLIDADQLTLDILEVEAAGHDDVDGDFEPGDTSHLEGLPVGAGARPTLAAIDRLRIDRLYRGAPPGDLFLVLHRHRRDAFPSTGCPHLAQTVVSVIGDGRRRRRLRLPGRGSGSPAQR